MTFKMIIFLMIFLLTHLINFWNSDDQPAFFNTSKHITHQIAVTCCWQNRLNFWHSNFSSRSSMPFQKQPTKQFEHTRPFYISRGSLVMVIGLDPWPASVCKSHSLLEKWPCYTYFLILITSHCASDLDADIATELGVFLRATYLIKGMTFGYKTICCTLHVEN